MNWTIWIMVSIILLVIEIITPGVFFFACLSLGALFAGASSFLDPPLWLPWFVFIVVSILSIYFIRPMALRMFKSGTKKSNIDELIGQTAHVTQSIIPPHLGMVKIGGEFWRAESSEEIQANNMVEVIGVKGTHLEVKKQ